MKYLMLWSGNVRGMKKQTIAAQPAIGFLSDTDGNGNLVTPNAALVRAALPARLRKAFDRSSLTRRHEPGNSPFWYELRNVRGEWITNVYLQPLEVES